MSVLDKIRHNRYMKDGRPTFCKGCGNELSFSPMVVEVDPNTGEPLKVQTVIFCSNNPGYEDSGHSYYRWTDDVQGE